MCFMCHNKFPVCACCGGGGGYLGGSFAPFFPLFCEEWILAGEEGQAEIYSLKVNQSCFSRYRSVRSLWSQLGISKSDRMTVWGLNNGREDRARYPWVNWLLHLVSSNGSCDQPLSRKVKAFLIDGDLLFVFTSEFAWSSLEGFFRSGVSDLEREENSLPTPEAVPEKEKARERDIVTLLIRTGVSNSSFSSSRSLAWRRRPARKREVTVEVNDFPCALRHVFFLSSKKTREEIWILSTFPYRNTRRHHQKKPSFLPRDMNQCSCSTTSTKF